MKDLYLFVYDKPISKFNYEYYDRLNIVAYNKDQAQNILNDLVVTPGAWSLTLTKKLKDSLEYFEDEMSEFI